MDRAAALSPLDRTPDAVGPTLGESKLGQGPGSTLAGSHITEHEH